MPKSLMADGQCIFAGLHMHRRLSDEVLSSLENEKTSVINRSYGDVLARARADEEDIT